MELLWHIISNNMEGSSSVSLCDQQRATVWFLNTTQLTSLSFTHQTASHFSSFLAHDWNSCVWLELFAVQTFHVYRCFPLCVANIITEDQWRCHQTLKECQQLSLFLWRVRVTGTNHPVYWSSTMPFRVFSFISQAEWSILNSESLTAGQNLRAGQGNAEVHINIYPFWCIYCLINE